MEYFLREAARLVGTELSRVEGMRGILEEATTRIETELREREEVIFKRDSDLKEVEERLATQLRDLERQLSDKEAILAARDAEIEDLKSELKTPFASPEVGIALKNMAEVRPSEEREEAQGSSGSNAAEKKAKLFGRSLRDIVIERGKAVKIEAGQDQKKFRLRNLLGPVQKKG